MSKMNAALPVRPSGLFVAVSTNCGCAFGLRLNTAPVGAPGTDTITLGFLTPAAV